MCYEATSGIVNTGWISNARGVVYHVECVKNLWPYNTAIQKRTNGPVKMGTYFLPLSRQEFTMALALK
jgi:hypothetical protein